MGFCYKALVRQGTRWTTRALCRFCATWDLFAAKQGQPGPLDWLRPADNPPRLVSAMPKCGCRQQIDLVVIRCDGNKMVIINLCKQACKGMNSDALMVGRRRVVEGCARGRHPKQWLATTLMSSTCSDHSEASISNSNQFGPGVGWRRAIRAPTGRARDHHCCTAR